jgi:Cys-rich protein (TIGR01571 family)
VGPLASGNVEHGQGSSRINIDAKHPPFLYDDLSQVFFGKNWFNSLLLYLPYAILVLIFAAIWYGLDGRIPPTEERDTYRGRDFEYGLFDADHIFNHHMWICVCAFCCCPIRMADTYSKEGKTKPIIEGFWVALAVTLIMCFWVDLACVLGVLLFLCFAVYFRQKIRETYGLPGGGVTLLYDCLSWCFCPWCTAAQEARQVECAGLYQMRPGSSASVAVPRSGALRY